MTEEEKACLALTAVLWNALLELPPYAHEREEHMRDIHNIQNRLMARPTRRESATNHPVNPAKYEG